MYRRLFSRSAGGLVLAAAASSAARAQAPRPHRMVIHVGGGDPVMMNVALHNIVNAAEYYRDRNETVAIELVANGPGYAMLQADVSPVKPLLAKVHAQFPFVVFSACQNTRRALAMAAGKKPEDIREVAEATDVPAGIVRASELQEQGWSYVRV